MRKIANELTSMSGKPRTVLPDTNILIPALRKDPVILQELGNVAIALSVTVLGELYHGAFASRRSALELADLAVFISQCAIVPCDEVTAQHYGQIRLALRQAGTPIPENDIWIAAVSLQHSVPLITRDAHFSYIPGLTVEQW